MNQSSNSNGIDASYQTIPTTIGIEADDWEPPYEDEPWPEVIREAAKIEELAAKGKAIPRPGGLPESRWNRMGIRARAMAIARLNHGQETWVLLEELEEPQQVQPPKTTLIPHVYFPEHMTESKILTPADVWKGIEMVVEKEIFPDLQPEDARNLWAVYTGRNGKLILLVIPSEALEYFVWAGKPCPITIRDAPGYIDFSGEVQSLSGWARIGGAANVIGRLAFFRQTPSMLKCAKGADPAEALC